MEEDQCRVAELIANQIEGNTLGFKSSLFRHLENELGKRTRTVSKADRR